MQYEAETNFEADEAARPRKMLKPKAIAASKVGTSVKTQLVH
jgi:hypothetical protein